MRNGRFLQLLTDFTDFLEGSQLRDSTIFVSLVLDGVDSTSKPVLHCQIAIRVVDERIYMFYGP